MHFIMGWNFTLVGWFGDELDRARGGVLGSTPLKIEILLGFGGLVTNSNVHLAVHEVVLRAVDRFVSQIMPRAVRRAVDRAMHEAVDRAVYWDVARAVHLALSMAEHQAVFEDPTHPGLERYLETVVRC